MSGVADSSNAGELRSDLGEMVREHDPFDVEGCPISATLRPDDIEALARSLEALSRRGLAAVVRGGGSRAAFGNSPARADVLLSTTRLSGVRSFEAEDGVVEVFAGTPVATLRAEANASGWELPLDPPGDGTTIGGTLAAAALGPRRQGFGPARDCVLGLEVVLASGVRSRCGGRVVKNVTGYDLAKLYTGSFGTLGVLASAWLRLTPLAERVSVCEARMSAAAALELGVASARRPSARAVAVLSPPQRGSSPTDANGSDWRLVAEFAGDAPASERDEVWLAESCGAVSAPADVLDRVRTRQGAPIAPDGLRARLSLLPSALVPACLRLADAGAELLVYPGLGLVFAEFRFDGLDLESRERTCSSALEVVDATVDEARGELLLEELPLFAKSRRDVFGDPGPALALMRSLKLRFDPAGVLNPGRFAGRL